VSLVTAESTVSRPAPTPLGDDVTYGPLGRLGMWTASHFRAVLLAWVVIALGLGVFAPRAQHALAGAGWEASGSESVAARHLVDSQFAGLSSAALQVVVHSDTQTVTEPAMSGVIGRAQQLLGADRRISRVVPPAPGVSISRDGHTAVIQAGAAGDTNAMVRAADALKGPLTRLSGSGVTVALTGSSGLWSDFNAANHAAMMRGGERGLQTHLTA